MSHQHFARSVFCSLVALLPTAAFGEGRLGLSIDRACFSPEVGGLKCWGAGSTAIIPVRGLSEKIASNSAGANHFCYLTDQRVVRCFGSNENGQLGTGGVESSTTPVDVPGLSPSIDVASGYGNSCALNANGGVQCWGGVAISFSPVSVSGLSGPALAVAAGGSFACAIIATGDVECWGWNVDGQLGNGSRTSSDVPTRVVGLPRPAVAIATAVDHACAITDQGALFCWGDNANGELGDGTTSDSSVAKAVVGLSSGVLAIDGGEVHTCAVVTGGAVKCWGWDAFGALGDGPGVGPQPTGSYTPKAVVGIAGAVDVDLGRWSSCAVFPNDRVKCWGDNEHGQLGDGTTIDRSSPVDVQPLSPLHFRVFASGFDS